MAKQIGFFDVLRFAAGYWVRQPLRLAVIVFLLILSGILETYQPTVLSHFIAAVRANESHDVILKRLGIFLGISFAEGLFYFSCYAVYNIFESKVFQGLVNDAFAHIYRLSEHFFINTFTGSIISKITRARSKIETFEDQILLHLFSSFIVLAGSLLFMAARLPELALMLAAYFAFLLTASMYFIFRISGPAQEDYANGQDSLVAKLADNVGGIVTTKAYAMEATEETDFFERTRLLQKKNAHAYILGTVAGFIQRVLRSGMLTLLVGGGTWYLFRGKATVEDIVYLIFAYMIIEGNIQRLGDNIKNLLTASYDLHAVIRLMREPPEVATADEKPDLTISKGAITFDQVTFAYPGKTEPVFDNLSVSIKAGERIALVGHSGSGKTTFVRLVQCLYGLQKGRILIDGQDITQGSRHSLRSSIALVPQDPILFHRSLSENIAYANPSASFEDVQDAARKAHIDHFIQTLPQKYDTLVGERGIKLSGGERQRIAIARAILANRPILILDEATSSLDSESERAIQDALLLLTHGRTSIMIAHRLSTILDADRILVFDKGRIVEQGRHEDLVKIENGIYAGFYALQTGGFIKED